MRTMLIFALTLAATLASLTALGAITTSEVTYTSGGTTLKGYLAKPQGEGRRPGVLVVH